MKKIFSILIAAAFIFIAKVSAQSNVTPRFALVIGNQTYEESPLKNPVADAKLMKSALEKCGFDVTFATDLNQAEMFNVVADYADKVAAKGKDTISFFYYSGHGVQIEGKNYMVPVNNKGIASETKAKAVCYSVDQLFSFVPSLTQVAVLDACRNNPFSSEKLTFAKGLSRIANPKNVPNFIAFFSTSDGATADDGDGKNSLFTEKLSNHITGDYNTPISSVFNSVASDVKEKTKGRQTPLITGTGVNFELMNAEVAAAKIKLLQSSLKVSGSAAKKSVTYDSEAKLIQAEIEMLQARKAEAEKDAKLKAEQKKKETEVQKKNQKEMEQMQKAADAQKKKFQSQKAKEKSSIQFIGEIEDNKEALQKIRLTCADKIYDADTATQKKNNARIDEINNAPLKATEKDAKGNISSDTKKKRKAAVKVVEAENKAEKQKNYDTFYEKISAEETDRLARLKADEATLSGAVYTATSFIDETQFTVSNYDGENNQWLVYVNSNILGRKDLFKTVIPMTYEQICSVILDKKYVAPKDMDEASFNQYSDDVDTYELAFHGKNPPLVLEVDYKVAPAVSGISKYVFSAQCVRIKFMKEGDSNPVINEKNFFQKAEVVWGEKQTELKTVSEILKAYAKRDAAEEKARQKALKSKK